MSIFSKSVTLGQNVGALEKHLGFPCEKVALKIATLKRHGRSMTIAARPGSFVSLAFLHYLGGGKEVYNIDADRHKVVEEFFGPIWDEPGHAVVDFLRTPGVQVVQEVFNHGEEVLQIAVKDIWENRDNLSQVHTGAAQVSEMVMKLLNFGVYRVAEPDAGAPNGWKTNEWLKQAILLYFKLHPMVPMGEIGDVMQYYDKVPLKFTGWASTAFARAGFRVVPGAIVRTGAFIDKSVILMPSFVNIGAFVGANTMIDTWATVGSCAQIGNDCHLSGGAGIGGVLEPLQAVPTIIEDGCFIGARSEVAEGVVVKRRAVLSMGVFIGKNTPIVDMTKLGSGSSHEDIEHHTYRGVVPENAVVMMGVHPTRGLICPRVVKYRDDKTDAATALNSILR